MYLYWTSTVFFQIRTHVISTHPPFAVLEPTGVPNTGSPPITWIQGKGASGHIKVKRGTGHVFYMATPSHTNESVGLYLELIQHVTFFCILVHTNVFDDIRQLHFTTFINL